MIPVYPEGSLDRSQAVQAPDSAPLKNSLNHMNTVVENFETGNIPTRLPLFYKLEDLQILSDLLKQESDRTPGADDSASCTFNSVIDRAIDKTCMQAFIETQQKGRPLFIKKGDEFFKKGDFQKALKAWHQVLKIDPDDADIHLKLGTIGKLSSPLAQTAENLHAEYCFHYLDSFGHTELRNPVAMVIIPDERILFISDYTGDKIHKFNTDGEYLETLVVEVKQPLGLFKDAANHIWICDFGHNRLVEIDSTGRFLNELRLKNDDANAPGSLNPAYGCIHDGRFFILLRDDTGFGYGRVIAFDRNNPQGSLVVLSQKMYLPSTIEFANGVLYVGDGYRNYLYIFDSIRQRFSAINGLYVPLYQRWVCSFMENLFVSAGDFICKISTRGKLIFAANLKNIIRNENAVPHGLAVFEENNRRFLLVVDFRLACIHRFAI